MLCRHSCLQSEQMGWAFSILSSPCYRQDCDIITVTSQWARRRLKSPVSPLFTGSFTQAQNKENIKAPRHWPLCGEFTGDRWIPRKNGQLGGNFFHLMTSSWYRETTRVPVVEASPDSKVYGANVGPTWGRQDPGGPHVGHMNFAIWATIHRMAIKISAFTTAISGWRKHSRRQSTKQRYYRIAFLLLWPHMIQMAMSSYLFFE